MQAKKRHRARYNASVFEEPMAEEVKLDQVRQRVVQNIEKVLQSGKAALLSLSNKRSAEGSSADEGRDFDVPDNLDDIDVRALAIEIEEALDTALSGDAYKEKFRTLHFNLKQLGNACNVLSGKISPAQLISMSVEDLANEHLKLMNEKIKRESLRESVLTEEMAVLLLKKTELTDTAKEKSTKNDNGDQLSKVITSNVAPPVSGEVVILPTVPVQSPAAAEEKQEQIVPRKDVMISGEAENEVTVSPIVEEPPAIQEDLPIFSPTIEHEDTKDSNSLEALLAKVNAQKVLVPVELEQPLPPPSSDTVASFEPDHFLASEHEPDHRKFFEGFPQVWSGKVAMEATGSFQGKAKFAGGTQSIAAEEWVELLTPALEVGGRINPMNVFTYLDDQVYNEARQISLLTVEVDVANEENEQGHKSLWEYFASRSRYAVIEKKMPKVKDLYLIPLSNSDSLPDFMSAIDHSIPTSGRDSDVLVAVMWVTLTLTDAIVPASTAGMATTSSAPVANQNYYPVQQDPRGAPPQPVPPYGYGGHNMSADPRGPYPPPPHGNHHEPQQYHHHNHPPPQQQSRPSYQSTTPYYRDISPAMAQHYSPSSQLMHPDRMQQVQNDNGDDWRNDRNPHYDNDDRDYRRSSYQRGGGRGNDRRNSRGRGGGGSW